MNIISIWIDKNLVTHEGDADGGWLLRWTAEDDEMHGYRELVPGTIEDALARAAQIAEGGA